MKKDKTDMFLGASPQLFEFAKQLRLNETEAEKVLWRKLSNKQLGVKFRRQHPLYDFIADFYCHSLRLVVEVDGGAHLNKSSKEYDELRTDLLNKFNIEVIRFTNDEVLTRMDEVLMKIRERMRSRSIDPKMDECK